MQIKNFAILLASLAATNVLANPVPEAEGAAIEARAEQAEQGAQAEQVQQGAQGEQAQQGEQWWPGRRRRYNPYGWRQNDDWWRLRNPFPGNYGNRWGWDGQQCPWQQQSCWNCQGFYQGNQGVCSQGWARGCPCY